MLWGDMEDGKKDYSGLEESLTPGLAPGHPPSKAAPKGKVIPMAIVGNQESFS